MLSEASSKMLETCDVRLQKIVVAAELIFPLEVTCGHRGEELQNAACGTGHSDFKWPDSKHNEKPSMAVDVRPVPLDWENIPKFILMAGIIIAVAHSMDIKIRWGGDWGCDWKMKGEDFGHYEILETDEDIIKIRR